MAEERTSAEILDEAKRRMDEILHQLSETNRKLDEWMADRSKNQNEKATK